MIRQPGLVFAMGLLLALGERASAQDVKFLKKTAFEWANQLKSDQSAARRNAAFALGKMGSFALPALSDLKKALNKESDAKAREAMVWAAGEIAAGMSTDTELEGLLITAMRDGDKFVRRSAACSLGLLGSSTEASRVALNKGLSDPEQIVRQNAAWALGQLDEKAVPMLVIALGDGTSDSLVKRDIANALFTASRTNPELMRPAIADLLKMCTDPDPEVRKAGLVPLVKVVSKKDALAIPVLRAVLQDRDPEVKRYAALALSNVGGSDAKEAVPILVDALRHGEPHLKRSAAVALHNIGSVAESAVPDLVKALQDPDPELRKGAALALGGIGRGAADAVPWLVQITGDTDQPLDVRIQTAEALTQMKKIPAITAKIPDVLKVLGNANEDGNLRVRLAWLFNEYVSDDGAMKLAYPTMAKVCGEPEGKDNGATRYHCAYLLSFKFRKETPEAALNVLSEWLKDTTGKLYLGKDTKVDAQGVETKGGTTVDTKLYGDSRTMATDALLMIGAVRVGPRKDIVEQLRVLAKDADADKELREKSKKLLTILGQ